MSIQQSLTGKTLGVYLGLDKVSFVTTPQPQVKVTFAGFDGDRHAGITRKADSRTPHYPRGTEIRSDRQISIVSVEELAQIAMAMDLPEIKPEWLGANLLLQGIPSMTSLPPMTRLFFGARDGIGSPGRKFTLPTPRQNHSGCYSRPGLQVLFPKAGMHLRGLVACVERPGAIGTGDPVRVEIPQQTPLCAALIHRMRSPPIGRFHYYDNRNTCNGRPALPQDFRHLVAPGGKLDFNESGATGAQCSDRPSPEPGYQPGCLWRRGVPAGFDLGIAYHHDPGGIHSIEQGLRFLPTAAHVYDEGGFDPHRCAYPGRLHPAILCCGSRDHRRATGNR